MRRCNSNDRVTVSTIDTMELIIENRLNPKRYRLEEETKKRLKWMYIIEHECHKNVSKAARKIGVSRPWLSTIYNKWKRNNRDPRVLRPESKAPLKTTKRRRLPAETVSKIIEVRKKYPDWGKEKLSRILERDYGLIAKSTTVNNYLREYGLINQKISKKNKLAFLNKKTKAKIRPPKELTDYKPGALLEKDMKYVRKPGSHNSTDPKSKENFWLQHTIIDSFSRIRVLTLAKSGESNEALDLLKEAIERLPFNVGSFNTDNGSENEGVFSKFLEGLGIKQFYSRSGTPTDNPRVERSHLTDSIEFYKTGSVCEDFDDQSLKTLDWEYVYNFVRPHQALNYLTPMEFLELFLKAPDDARSIVDNYQVYLKKNRKRLASSRRLKRREKIVSITNQIDRNLSKILKI